ncbi:MFS transporter [Coleofasciculus sp. FACHB-1120]|uniref:MFS transporter n=1 Tax=Coleofasciculus sp. FACHB-1120 TaxID=2692783 RepID=UPI001686A594|nr:MFS transporter [Coleofasciculus sp. FACHB-1120]MBD2742107.1 MFS transporter [Coleofasciculus sp. FACHB-1120]
MKTANPDSLLVKITLLVTSTLTVMSGATIAPSLPAMRAYFSGVENVEYWVKLVLTVPALFIVIGAPISGLIVDRLGRKSLLVASTILYGFAGSSGFLLNSIGHILMGRAFLGLAVAGVMTSATTLIADYYIGQARASFMGLQAAFMAFGGVLFLSGGGFLADLNWRLPFLIYLSAFIILPFIVVLLYEPRRTNVEIDTVQESGGFASDSVLPITRPPFPIKLLTLIYGVALLMQVIFYLIPVQLPFYLQTLTKASATQSGLAIAFATLFSAFASMLYGRIKARLHFVSILALAFALIGIGYSIIGLGKSYEQVLIGLAVAGLGLGFLMPNLTVWLSAESPEALRGRLLGGLTTFLFLGQFLSPIVSQPVSQQVGLGSTYRLAGGLLLLLALIFQGMRRQIAVLTANPAQP